MCSPPDLSAVVAQLALVYVFVLLYAVTCESIPLVENRCSGFQARILAL